MKKGLSILFFLLLFVSETVSVKFEKVSEFVIRDESSGEVYFTGKELRRGTSGSVEVRRLWFDNRNDTAYIEKSLYNPQTFQIDWVKIENRVTKESEHVRRVGNRYTVRTVDKRGRPREKTIDTKGNTKEFHPVVLVSLAKSNFNEILRDKFSFDLLATDRGRTFGFHLKKEREVTIESQTLTKITMEGRNAVVRALAPDIFFYFQIKNGKPALERYRGILLMPIDGEKGRRIEIEYTHF